MSNQFVVLTNMSNQFVDERKSTICPNLQYV